MPHVSKRVPDEDRHGPSDLVGIERHDCRELRLHDDLQADVELLRLALEDIECGPKRARISGSGAPNRYCLNGHWPFRSASRLGELRPTCAETADRIAKLSSRTFTRGSPRNPRSRPSTCSEQGLHCWTDTPRAFATRAAWISALRGLMCGSNPDAEAVTASAGTGSVAGTRAAPSVVEGLDQLHIVEIAVGVLELVDRDRRLERKVVLDAVVHDAILDAVEAHGFIALVVGVDDSH